MEKNLVQFIKSRRSIRSFEQKSVPKEVLEDIIQAGRYAPSAKNSQPWKFIVITNKDLIKDLSKHVKDIMRTVLKRRFLYRFFEKSLRDERQIQLLAGMVLSKKDTIFHEAPALVFIITKKALFNNESCACCAQNMMLAAHAHNIGSCWIGFAHFLDRNNRTREKIGIPDGYHIAATIVFGYPDKKPGKAPIRRVDADVMKWCE